MKNFLVIDTVDTFGNKVKALELTFNFADGDGNLSSSDPRQLVTIPPDTIPKDTSTNSKIFLKLFEKKHGVYTAIPDTALLTPTSFLIPFGEAMKREGQNKTEKGEIKINYLFYYSLPNSQLPFDTIQIELYIVDLGYMKSNVITATDISLTKK